MKKLLFFMIFSSCSLFGIQNEESPKYEVLKSEGTFEIRRYKPYIVAKTTVKGDYEKSSGKAFKILAGYIFGKNKGEKSIAMTSPVEMKEEMKKEPAKIAMTSPVEMKENEGGYTMTFSMPSKYTLENLPEPEDDRISFEEVKPRLVAVNRFSWFRSKEKSEKKAQDLREWVKRFQVYDLADNYSYAGYNPPWTLPPFKRHEIMIEIQIQN